MNIHEYQAKGLLAKYGVAVPRGGVAFSAEEAVKVAEELGGPVWVVKAQIHAGGRGKGGGVKVVKSVAEARQATDLANISASLASSLTSTTRSTPPAPITAGTPT